jgi:LytS/YehU family sensor histidine kinase
MRLSLTDQTLSVKKNRISLIVLSVIALVCALLFWMRSTSIDLAVPISIGWMVIISLLLWVGNRFLTTRLDSLLPWSKFGNYRFFIHLILGLVYLLVLVNATYLILKLALTTDPPTVAQMIVTNVHGAFIFIPLFSIYFSLQFLRHWRKSELEVERYQKENMRSQLESLKSHLDPHFLFNNLNILSALIDKNPAKSKEFMDKFSDVYRFLLKTKSDDLIPLADEIDFIQSYVFLIRTRFDDNIIFNMKLRAKNQQRMLPPLALQMLVENAIKHNIIQENRPLSIDIIQLEDDYLVVRNSLNEKREANDRNGSGLENIKSRYSHFTDKPVKIIKTSTEFEVHIPLLEIENV